MSKPVFEGEISNPCHRAASPCPGAIDADGTPSAGISPTGPETEERYTELRDVVDQHCPVLDLFVNATPVSATVTKG